MRWTFKRLVIWFVAFVVTGLGSSLYHSNLCTVLQIGIALLLGWPVVLLALKGIPSVDKVLTSMSRVGQQWHDSN